MMADDFPQLLALMQQGQREGLHAVALFSFELGAALQGVDMGRRAEKELAQVLLFGHVERLSAVAVDA